MMLKKSLQSNQPGASLKLALAFASILALDATAAPASVNVTYSGVVYEIGMIASTYNQQNFNYSAQPWWNNYALASNLAALVGSSLGTPNFTTQAPYFGYGLVAGEVDTLYNNGSGEVDPGSITLDFNAWWAYVLSTPTPIITNPAAYNQTLMNAGSAVSMGGVNMPSLTLDGAHHRTLLDSGLTHTVGEGYGMWATADAAHYESSNSSMQIAEVGLYKDVHLGDKRVSRIGLGVGQLWNRQGLMYDGYATYNGQYLLAEVDTSFASHFKGTINAYYGDFDTKVSRNYEIISGIGTSVGHTNTASMAVRLRVDMPDVVSLGKLSLSPYAAYTWSRADTDAYTEAGGDFPASYNKNKSTNNKFRVGLGTQMPLGASTKLVVNTEAVHSTDGKTSGTSGQIIGLNTFSVPGQSVRQTWARLMVDVDHKLTDKSLISLGLNASSQGGDPSYGGTISYRAAF